MINPAFLWAAAGVAMIPIAIYLLNRRRHRKIRWAAMHFLLSASRKSIKRTRLEQLLLLVLRTLLITMLALSLARPYWPSRTAPTWLHEGTHHILVLDNSLSMSAPVPRQRSGSEQTLFDLQINRAQHLLAEIPTGDPISIMTMASPVHLLNLQPTFDKELASRLLLSVRCGQSVNDFQTTLTKISEILDADNEHTRELALYFFSDFTRPIFSTAGGPDTSQSSPIENGMRQLAEHGRIVLHDVGQSGLSNVMCAELRPAGHLIGTRQPTDFVCTVRNDAKRMSAGFGLHVYVDQQRVREFEIPALDADQSHTVLFAHEFPTPGLHTLEAVLNLEGPDALAADNTRRCVLEVRESTSVLIVDGKPGVTALQGHAGYLKTALAPGLDNQELSLIRPHVVTEKALQSLDLNPYDAMILCNVRRLEAAQWQRIIERIRQGAGLILFMGDHVDLEHYNRFAAEILPAPLKGPAYDQVSDDQFTRFAAGSLHELLAPDFRGRKESGLFFARIHQYIRATPGELSQGKCLLNFENGDPAILHRTVAQSRILLVTTTANMEWTNLPAKGDYVTLMFNLLQLALPENAPTRNLVVHDRFEEMKQNTSAAVLAGCHLKSPDGSDILPDMSPHPLGVVMRAGNLERAGWYTLQTPMEESPVAVNTATQESDLTKLSPQKLRELLDCPYEYVGPDEEDLQWVAIPTVEYASMMISIVLLIMLVESALAMWFSHQRH